MKMIDIRPYRFSGLLIAAMVTLLAFTAPARAVMLTESMVFMNAKQSSAIFSLKNTSDKPQAFKIDFVELKMNEKGGKESIPQGASVPGVMPASPHVYVAPRRLVLQPGQLQYVRFMLRRNRDMVPGEYRSYVTIIPESMPTEYVSGEVKEQAAAAKMNVMTGYRIPIFFLQGDASLDLQFSNISRGTSPDGQSTLSFTAQRSGNRSALGEAEIVCTMPDGKIQKLGFQRIQIFTELSHRNYTTFVDPAPAGCSNTVLQFIPHKDDPLYKGMYEPVVKVPL